MALFSHTPGDGPRRRSEPASLSIVAADLQVTGDLDTEGVVKIEGHVRGSVRAVEQILVAAGATVEGDLVTREAVVGGVVCGAIEAGDRVELLPTAVVTGNIVTARLLIHEGSRLNGEVAMRNGEEALPSPGAAVPERFTSHL